MDMQQMRGNANAGVATGRAGTNQCFKKGSKKKQLWGHPKAKGNLRIGLQSQKVIQAI